MSKILEASCAAGIVTADNLPVAGSIILSEGVKPSTGVLLLEEDKATYVTSSASDIKDLITNLETIIDQLVITLTAIDAVTTAPGSNAASIATLTALKTSLLTVQKGLLK